LSTDAWITPGTLECAGIVRDIRLEPLEPRHAPDLFAAADPELFLHTAQAPMEWSVRGFEIDAEKIRSMPGVVAFAIVLARGERAGRAIGRTTFMDIKPEHRGLEIGRTWIGRAYHGTRVNPEAKYLMLR
jgi:RimJ/RimL family protein N-acetyltransferase